MLAYYRHVVWSILEGLGRHAEGFKVIDLHGDQHKSSAELGGKSMLSLLGCMESYLRIQEGAVLQLPRLFFVFFVFFPPHSRGNP